MFLIERKHQALYMRVSRVCWLWSNIDKKSIQHKNTITETFSNLYATSCDEDGGINGIFTWRHFDSKIFEHLAFCWQLSKLFFFDMAEWKARVFAHSKGIQWPIIWPIYGCNLLVIMTAWSYGLYYKITNVTNLLSLSYVHELQLLSFTIISYHTNWSVPYDRNLRS